ncbi:putative exported phage protein [Burkholderia multivorans]
MKKLTGTMLLAATAALASGTATATDPEAYVLAKNTPTYGTIPAADMIYALMLHRPCRMPIANARNLREARIFNNRLHPERFDVGCWGITLDPSRAEAVVIGPTGHVSSGMALMSFARATINRDGDGTALGPAMTMEEYQRNIDEYEKSIR